ncbi:MAG: hypothetical protein JSV79_01785 [Armatimonadota bacterium]|nr:MAG: hypothetical protein JSV79_01785 [Armatimonadota bacterium]
MTAAKPEVSPHVRGRASARDRWLPVVIGAVGCAVWLWFALSTRIALEDAFITFRYARNLAEGNGFVYNVGERVLGTTTPLQTLLLAVLGVVFGPARIPGIAAVVMPMFGIASGLLAYKALVRFDVPRAGAAAGMLMLYLHPVIVRTSLGGMETPLALLLMALGLYFLSKRRSVWATAAVALLALCRVDGLIWGALVLGATMLSRYRRPLKQAVAFGGVVIPWLIFATVYFQSPIPNSMLAKGVVRPGREDLLMQPLHFSRLSRFYLSGTGFEADHPLFAVWLVLMGLGVYAVVRARRRELLALPIFPVVYAVLMYVGRAPKYEWYVAPMLFCCLLLGGVGIGQVVCWVAGARVNWGWRAALAVCAAAVVVPVGSELVRELPRRARHSRLFQENEVGLRRAVGLWLRENTPEEASIAMEAIGYQGYFSERGVIDMYGLVTPEVVEYKASTGSNGELFKRIWTELDPDYIVLRSFEVDENRHFNGGKLFEAEADRELFFRQYREAKRFTAPHAELAPLVTHLTLYERRPG